MTQLVYSEGAEEKNRQYFNISQGFAIFSLAVIIIYTIARFFYNTLGGIYMCKRVILAMLLSICY